MKQYVMNVEPALIKRVDEIISEEKCYSSRNEFVRDAIRSMVLKYRKLKARKLLKEASKKCLERGWNGKMPTHEQREKILKEFVKEKGFSWDEL